MKRKEVQRKKRVRHDWEKEREKAEEKGKAGMNEEKDRKERKKAKEKRKVEENERKQRI